MKPKLLVIELWAVGDLMLGTPFLRAAAEKYRVTLLAKPHAQELKAAFWPEVEVVSLQAPWTAFRGKYRLHSWPWSELIRVRRELRRRGFQVAVSARWDPRDHFLLWQSGARRRIGFPRLGSGVFLNSSLERPQPREHRYEYWRRLGRALDLEVPERRALKLPTPAKDGYVLVHSGAARSVRVWPLERFHRIVARLRQQGWPVRVVADVSQRDWWLKAGETGVLTPRSIGELLSVIAGARRFIGNDSGPGHLAAGCGVTTFTIFGPQLPELFVPIHPQAEWIEGRPCPYKPCFDSCRLPEPICILGLSEEEVWARVERFMAST